MPATLTVNELAQFSGSETWYRHHINRKVMFTDGAKFVADRGGAHWLIDDIAMSQLTMRQIASEEFQVWCLRVYPDRHGALTCEDGNGRILCEKDISCTDFPLDEITLWFCSGTILLPGEY